MDAHREAKLKGSNWLAGDSPLDPTTGLPICESPLDYEVSKGNMWAFSHRIRSVGVNAFLYVQINTGAKPVKLHLVKFWTEASIVELDLLRAPTSITDGTTPIPIFRLNHTIDTPEPTGLALFSDPSVIVGGTLCQCNYTGGGDALGVGTRAQADQRGMPLIMSPETTYVISAKNINGDVRAIAVQGFFSVEQD